MQQGDLGTEEQRQWKNWSVTNEISITFLGITSLDHEQIQTSEEILHVANITSQII